MKKALDYLDYVTGCFNAITKGVKTVIDNWPTSNPFGPSGPEQDGVKK